MALQEGQRIAKDPERYGEMAKAARQNLKAYCANEVMQPKVSSIIERLAT